MSQLELPSKPTSILKKRVAKKRSSSTINIGKESISDDSDTGATTLRLPEIA